MHGLTGAVHLHEGDMFSQHTEQRHPLGAKGYAENGDIYRYTKLAADVSAGYLLTGLGTEPYHCNIAVTTANVVGDKKVVGTLGATAIDANEYDEGWLIFNDNSPEGEYYQISHHDANAGSLSTDIYLTRGLKTVTTTDSEFSLIRNPWNSPAVSQLITEPAAGVTVYDWDVSENEYGWLKTRGIAACLVDSSNITTGYIACISNATNGAMGVITGNATERSIAQILDTGTAGEFQPFNLFID